MPTHPEATGVLYSEEEKAGIQRQLDRLLGNPHFAHSKRFPTFLRFIVQEEIEGRGDLLKERTLGIEVFGRDAGYDTTSDPIVRVTAAEIRKRIAQYYQEPGHVDELRISLPPGSYVPHFDKPAARNTASSAVALVSPFPLNHEPPPVVVPSSKAARHTAIAAVLVLLILTTGAWLWTRQRPSTLDRFWAPVLNSGDSAIVCFPRSEFDTISLRDAANPEQQRQLQEKTSGLVLDDLQPLVSISGLLEMRHQPYILMGEDATTLTDLRRGPAIFIGAFDNAWTLRITRGLRFRFGNDEQMKHFWIEDTQAPAHSHWEIDRTQQVTTNNYRDYAIVARFLDPNTGKPAIVAAGIARGGTVAAGEFLTQPGDMDSIKSRAPKNWDGQNMEFVLSTEIIDGRSSPPKVEATYFW